MPVTQAAAIKFRYCGEMLKVDLVTARNATARLAIAINGAGCVLLVGAIFLAADGEVLMAVAVGFFAIISMVAGQLVKKAVWGNEKAETLIVSVETIYRQPGWCVACGTASQAQSTFCNRCGSAISAPSNAPITDDSRRPAAAVKLFGRCSSGDS
jgi:hypothetical protein